MDTKYKTERTERKAPDISVCAHLEKSTDVNVSLTEDGAWTISIRGWYYPSVTLFMDHEKLTEIRDTITAHLDDANK